MFPDAVVAEWKAFNGFGRRSAAARRVYLSVIMGTYITTHMNTDPTVSTSMNMSINI